MREVIVGISAAGKPDQKQSPREYLEELLSFPLQKELFQKASYNMEDIYPIADQMLAAGARRQAGGGI